LEGELAASQKETAELRTKASESRTELITLEREHRARSERQTAIVAEQERWQTRSAGAGEQIATLKERIAETQGEVATMSDLPGMIEGTAPES
jgi:chromosome segregation ATPase